MYIVYHETGGKKYASAAVSHRNGSKTSMTYTYLGLVLDEDAGIYKNKDRGVFKFDAGTGKFSDVDSSYVPPEQTDRRKRTERVSVDFGDAWCINQFLLGSGLMKIVDSLDYGNPDTLHAMLLFYMLSILSNNDAIHWYEGSVARLLYPDAKMTGQRISDFLKAIGTEEQRMAFQKAWINYVSEHYNKDHNILIDSTGLPNGIHMPYTQWSNHGGKVEQELRLIFVVQRSTGLPLFYQAVPGNIVDVSTLERVLLHVKFLGINVESCIIDAGYNSGDNLDLFYDENHQCKIDFITRLKSNDTRLKAVIDDELPTLQEDENFTRYEDRFLYIIKKKVMAGSNKDNPAWLYLGLDCARLTDEQNKLMKRAVKEKLDTLEVFQAMQTDGLFAVISGREYSCKEILPAYYQRQAAEQAFDFAKNYTKLLPLRTNSPETFRGHLLLSYIAACATKMLQLRLKTVDLFCARMAILRNLKCTIYSSHIVTDTPQSIANETYTALNIDCPSSFPIVGGRLKYEIPEGGTPAKKKQRKRNAKSSSSEKASKKSPSKETEKAAAPGKSDGQNNDSVNKKQLVQEAPEQDGQPPKDTKEHVGGTESKEIETPSGHEAGGSNQKRNIPS